MQVQRIQDNNYNIRSNPSFGSKSTALKKSKTIPQKLLTNKNAAKEGGDLMTKEINMILSGAVGTAIGAVVAALTGGNPLVMIAGLFAGLVAGAIPVILFMSNPENDVPELTLHNPLDFIRAIKEVREEEREQKERERRIEAKLPPKFDDTKSMKEELLEMVDWTMNFGPPT